MEKQTKADTCCLQGMHTVTLAAETFPFKKGSYAELHPVTMA